MPGASLSKFGHDATGFGSTILENGLSGRRSSIRGTSPLTNFAAARRMMVDGEVRTSDVTDPRIIAAMLELPRERFVPAAKADLAYLDFDAPVTPPGGVGRRLLKPMVLAKMVQAAAVREADRVLDVGCATGYSPALLAPRARFSVW